MATMVLSVTSGVTSNFKTAGKIKLTYTLGNGSVTITKVETYRTDSTSSSNGSTKGTYKITIGSVSKTFSAVTVFNKNSRATTAYSGSLAFTGLGSGSKKISVDITSSHANINDAYWSGSITTYTKPTVSALTVSAVSRRRIGASFTVSSNGGSSVTAQGIQVSTTSNFSSVTSSISALKGSVSGLTASTSYYVRGYATNAYGTTYTSVVSTKTKKIDPSEKNLIITNNDEENKTTNIKMYHYTDSSAEYNASGYKYKVYQIPKVKKPTYYLPLTVLDDGSVWVCIFRNRIFEGGSLFSSVASVIENYGTNQNSRLDLLETDLYKGSDGKFEFMLKYPIDAPGKYNRWKQTLAPQKEYKTSGTVTGYEAIHIDWTGNYWGGLTRFSEDPAAMTNTYITGSVHTTNWFYAIGAFSSYTSGAQQIGIPGPDNLSVWGDVELWVRIDDGDTVSSKLLYEGTSTTPTLNVSSIDEESLLYYELISTDSNTPFTVYSYPTYIDLRQFAKMYKKNNNLLPEGYTRLEYLANDNKECCYVTDYHVNPATKIDVTFAFDDTSTAQQRVFGTVGNVQQHIYINGSGYFAWTWQNDEGFWRSTNVPAFNHKRRAIMDGPNRKFTIVGEYESDIPENVDISNTAEHAMVLMAYENSSFDGVQVLSSVRIYRMKIYENDILVRDFIPAQDNATGEKGFIVWVVENGEYAYTYFMSSATGGEATPGPARTTYEKGKVFKKSGNTWKRCKEVYVNKNGAWKKQQG